MRRPEPTPEELRNAWRQCRRPTWPETFEEAMADALLSRLVRLNAMHPPRAYRTPPPAQRPRARAPVPQRDRQSQAVPGMKPGYFDHKRAAAGEREDD